MGLVGTLHYALPALILPVFLSRSKDPKMAIIVKFVAWKVHYEGFRTWQAPFLNLLLIFTLG